MFSFLIPIPIILILEVIPCSDRHKHCVNRNKPIIEINISYKMSIYYCAIKTQIVIILSKTLNTALSKVRSVSTLQFSEHFRLIFDNSNVKCCIFLFINNLQNYQIIRLPYPSKRSHFGIKSCSYQPQKPAFLYVRPVPTLSCCPFFHKLLILET